MSFTHLHLNPIRHCWVILPPLCPLYCFPLPVAVIYHSAGISPTTGAYNSPLGLGQNTSLRSPIDNRQQTHGSSSAPIHSDRPSLAAAATQIVQDLTVNAVQGAIISPLRPPLPVSASTGGAVCNPAAILAATLAVAGSQLQPRSPRVSGGGLSSSSPFANPPIHTHRGLVANFEVETQPPVIPGGVDGGGGLPPSYGSHQHSSLSAPQHSIFTEPPIWREVRGVAGVASVVLCNLC